MAGLKSDGFVHCVDTQPENRWIGACKVVKGLPNLSEGRTLCVRPGDWFAMPEVGSSMLILEQIFGR